MSKQRNRLLAGAAALALIAGSSLALAQDHTGTAQGQQGGASQSLNKSEGAGSRAQSDGKMGQSTQRQESSGQSGKMSQGQAGRSESGKMGQNAEPGKGAPGKMGEGKSGTQGGQKNAQGSEHGQRSERNAAQGTERTGRSTAERGATQTGREKGQRAEQTTREQRGNARENRAAEGMRQHGGGGITAETGRNRTGGTAREGRFEGMQGNAAGANVNLSDEQRTRIRETVIGARGAPRVGHVDFNVAVGTVIPRGRIHVVPVPQTLVEIEPQWRGFLYFIYEDEVVIVNPRNMRIVAVLPA